jgi:SAM-dependent methyltransferase
MGRAKIVNYNEQVYRHRWDTEELNSVKKVWEVLTRNFFQKYIDENSCVLDIGCGFCYFLNSIKAKEKVGVDANPAVQTYAANDVSIIQTSDLTLRGLPSAHFDCIFISNFLEHLENGQQVIQLLQRSGELLKPGGKIIILQPNFRLVGKAYFDFIDHKTVLTDNSLEEALGIAGFNIYQKIIRFLPYTTKSRLPQSPLLVRLYLWLRPFWLILGKQSLFIAVKRDGPGDKHNEI